MCFLTYLRRVRISREIQRVVYPVQTGCQKKYLHKISHHHQCRVTNTLLRYRCVETELLGTILWLGVMAMLAANGIWHLKGVLKTKSYSPGVITGLLLYVPLAIYVYIYFLSTDQLSFLTVLVVFVIGSSYQLWSNMFHRLRTK